MRVGGDTSLIEVEVVRIWSATNRDQQVRTDDLRSFPTAFDLHDNGVVLLLDANHFTVETQVNAFFPQEIVQR